MSTSIDVAIRVRPVLESEKRRNARMSRMRMDLDKNEIRLFAEDRQNSKVFAFDKVCDETQDQESFYKTVDIEKYIDRVMDLIFKGYHATIFCYGQTGAGKTYTMEGVEYDSLNGNRAGTAHKQNKIAGIKDDGIIPRAIRDIFKKVEILSKQHDRTYSVKVCCSFLEIYNEKVYDLLNPDQVSRMENNGPGLKLRWNKTDQFVVENLYVFTCNNSDEAQFLFNVGMKNKTMASHKLNNASSRSHAIFEFRIEYYENSNPEDIIVSKLDLVDLAGSERVSVISPDGRVTKETIDINKSLFTLRQVINCISENQNRQKEIHIPYRDSKLTSLLKQSIGGNAYCLMIACLAPTDESFEENLSTLTYATKVTKIKNEPIRNEDPKMRMIFHLKDENKELLQKLNDANERILHLTEKMGGKSGLTSKRVSKKPEDFLVPDGKNAGQKENSEIAESEVDSILKLKQNASEFGVDLQGLPEASHLTEELVEAINQIRYLLGQLKQEREKNELFSIQYEKQENLVAQLMRENQDLRDKIEFMENGDIHPTKSRSRSPNITHGLQQRRRSSKYERSHTSNAYGNDDTPNQNRRDRENQLMYTTLSTLHPDHEPVKGLISPQSGDYGNEKMITFSGPPQKRPTTNDSNSIVSPTDLENHFRTTTNFARNTIYRKFNITNPNYNENSGYDSQTNTEAYNSREMGMDISNFSGKTNSTPSHSRARNKSDYVSYGMEEGYQTSKLLRPKKDGDRSFQGKGSVDSRNPQYIQMQKPPSNMKAKMQNSKILLLKDVTHSITPIIQHPRSHASKLNRGLNHSFL